MISSRSLLQRSAVIVAAVTIGGVTAFRVDARSPAQSAGSVAGATTAGASMTRDAIAGRAWLEAAAKQMGGRAAIGHITGLHLVLTGDAFNGLQGFDPAEADSAPLVGPTSLTADFDWAHHLYRRASVQVLPGHIELASVTTYQPGRITTDFPNGHHTGSSAGPEPAVADGLLRFVPALFMQRALQNIAGATLAGEYHQAGARIVEVDVSTDAATRVRAHIDTTTNRLIALEGAAVDPLIGDDRIVYRFEGDRVVDGVAFPARINVERRGHDYIRFVVGDLSVNPTFDPSLFVPASEEPLQDTVATNALGGGVYEITGLDGGAFRAIFMDLGDGVAVFDAPESRTRSQWIAGEIAKTLGPKPIKYLVLSHAHDDHVVGVGYYVDHGAQIVTTRANAALVARFAVTTSQLRPDLPAESRAPSFLFVDGDRLTLNGPEHQRLEVLKLADSPHAKDMLMAFVPEQHLLIESDMFVELAGANDSSATLLRYLNRPDAPAVEWIMGPHLRRTSLQSLRSGQSGEHRHRRPLL